MFPSFGRLVWFWSLLQRLNVSATCLRAQALKDLAVKKEEEKDTALEEAKVTPKLVLRKGRTYER